MVKGVLGLILARGGSKGIPNKNLAPFAGRPLIDWTILQLQTAGIPQVFVSTDSPQIAARAQQLDAFTIERPRNLASDTANGDSAVHHAIRALNLQADDTIVLAQATSPLRQFDDVRQALTRFEAEQADSLFSAVVFEDLCLWEAAETLMPISYDPRHRSNRQQRVPQVIENGSFYIFRVSGFLAELNRLHGSIRYFPMPKWALPEIDDPSDLDFCERLFLSYGLHAEPRGR